MSFKLAVFISGRGSNFEALADHIEKEQLPIEIAVVLSDKKKAKGLEIAVERGLKTVVVPRNPKSQSAAEFNLKLAEAIKPFEVNLVVLAGFMRVLEKEFISQYPDKIINIHPSLLPSFRGLDVHQRALDAGVKFSGCSVHYVVEEVDAGPIIGQSIVPVLGDDTADTLATRIIKTEHKLLPKVVEGLAARKIKLNNARLVEVEPDFQGTSDADFLINLKTK